MENLSFISDAVEVRENIRAFNEGVLNHFERARSLASQSTYWIHDEESGLFGPGKFVGFRNMNFLIYNQAVSGEAEGAAFDGGATKKVLAQVIGEFSESLDLQSKLSESLSQLFGAGILESIQTSKWRFSEIESHRRYWALVCNPDLYDGLKATRELDELCWTLDRGDPQPGDYLVVWQAKGSGNHRGIIAFGEVISPPGKFEETPEESKFWKITPEPGTTLRTKFRVFEYPNVPIWETQDPSLLSNLSCAKARGGTVFSLTREQWNALVSLAQLDQNTFGPTQRVKATGQGYGLNAMERKAIELHAMEIAKTYFSKKNFKVKDVSKTSSYDLHCTREGNELHVEVKGTTSQGSSVFLTRNEVALARKYPEKAVLFIVSSIRLSKKENGFEVTGGEDTVYWPWHIDDGELTPTEFEYRVPPAH